MTTGGFNRIHDLLKNYFWPAQLANPQAGPVPVIYSYPGVGKSAIAKLLAKEMGAELIDKRLALLYDGAEIKGIPFPDVQKRLACYLFPEDMPTDNGKPYILFLDEITRARPDVLQAVFQLVWDRKAGSYKLPKNVFIMLASNLGEADRTNVAELDSALNNRFCHLFLEPVMSDYVPYFNERGLDFITDFWKALPELAMLTEKGFASLKETDRAYHTYRSWEICGSLVKPLFKADGKDLDINLIGELSASVVGSEASMQWMKWLRLQGKGVTPREVIDNFQKVKSKIEKLDDDARYSLNEGIKKLLGKEAKVDANQTQNVIDYARGLRADHRKEFMSALFGIKSVSAAISSRSDFKEILAMVRDGGKDLVTDKKVAGK